MEFKENYTQQLQRLNEYQKAAVFDESSACLVNANVGSGKTILAFLAMIMTVENGYQAVLMAPTEVLARQHFP